jgi:hypothetical protein
LPSPIRQRTQQLEGKHMTATTPAAVGSPHQAAEKIAHDLGVIADKLDRLRDRSDWTSQGCDAVVAEAVERLSAATKSTARDRAKRAVDADAERQADLTRARAARSPVRTSRTDRMDAAHKKRT